MKQVICLVNDEEKDAISRQLPSAKDVFFAKDISDFSLKLTDNSLQIISLSRIDESNSKEISRIIKKHSGKNFYILDKNPRNVENYLFEILTSENILASPYSLFEIMYYIKHYIEKRPATGYKRILFWPKLNDDYESELMIEKCKKMSIDIKVVNGINEFVESIEFINDEVLIILSIFHADSYLDELEDLFEKHPSINFHFHWRMDEDTHSFNQMKLLFHPNAVTPEAYSTLLRLAQQ